MTEQNTAASAAWLDKIKWLLVVALVVIAAVGNVHYEEVSLWYRIAGVVALLGAAGFVAWTTEKGAAFAELVRGAYSEVFRVTWPTRQETLQTTLIVVLVVFVVGLMLWGIDSLISWLIKLLLA